MGHMMTSKAELQRLLEVAEIANDRLTRAHDTLKRDYRAIRDRESDRMRRDHAEQQEKRRKAEHEAVEKRLADRRGGIFRLDDAESTAIVREAARYDDPGRVMLEVTFELTDREVRAVQDRLAGRGGGEIKIDVLPWQQRVMDVIHRI